MREIQFTQYLFPDGRKKPVWIKRPKEVADKADRIAKAGYLLECEMLPETSMVSLTIHNSDTGEDEAIELAKNGPKVPEAVDRLIMNFSLVEEEL